MGRWLAALARRSEEKNGERPKARTDETDKIALNEVLSVLSVPTMSVCENFSGGNEDLEAEILERAGLCSGGVPEPYLGAWAAFNHRRPARVSEAEWRQALDDGGLFLDKWGALAAELGWTAGELFDVPKADGSGGLIWGLAGGRIEALGPDHARLASGDVLGRPSSRHI